MQAMQYIREEKLEELIDTLVEQEGQVSVTYQTPRGWKMVRSSLISGSASTGFLTATPVPMEHSNDGVHPAVGDQLTVTFRRGHKKCIFSSDVTCVEQKDDLATVKLKWPEFVGQLQRRLCERVSPPPHQVIPVRIWLNHEKSPGSSDLRIVRNGQIEDLSVGGIRVKVPLADEFQIGSTYSCAFTPQRGDPAVVVDGILRHREATDEKRACLGLQFAGLESSTAGRQTIEVIAKMVQRFQRSRTRSRR